MRAYWVDRDEQFQREWAVKVDLGDGKHRLAMPNVRFETERTAQAVAAALAEAYAAGQQLEAERAKQKRG